MLISQSSAHVIDNTGGALVNCIMIVGDRRFGSLGDRLVVSLRKETKNRISEQKKVSVGKVYRALIVQTKKERRRKDGSTLKFNQNAVILLNKQHQPIGTRIKGAVPRELQDSPFLKTISLGANVV